MMTRQRCADITDDDSGGSQKKLDVPLAPWFKRAVQEKLYGKPQRLEDHFDRLTVSRLRISHRDCFVKQK